MLNVIVQANMIWVDEALPGVFSLYLPQALFFFINAIESLLVRICNFRLGFLVDLADAPSVDSTPRCLHLELFENVIGSIYVRFSFSIDLKYFTTTFTTFIKIVILILGSFCFLKGLSLLSGYLVHPF